LTIVALPAAAIGLAACGNDEPEETAPDNPPAADAGAPAVDAAAPAMDVDAPAMDAGAPAMDVAAASAVTIESVTGRWAETAALCGTDDEVTITAEAINMTDGACIVTGTEELDAALNIDLICPVAGVEPDTATWVVTAAGEAPFTAIAIAMDNLVTDLVRCP
jgi:hypothetical protein